MERKIIGTWKGKELEVGFYYHLYSHGYHSEQYLVVERPIGQLSTLPTGLSEGIIALGEPVRTIGGHSRWHVLCNVGTKEDVDYIYNKLHIDLGKTWVDAGDIISYLNSKNKTISAV